MSTSLIYMPHPKEDNGFKLYCTYNQELHHVPLLTQKLAYRLSSRCWWHKQRQTPIHTKSISEHCCWSWCKISAQNFTSVELCWIFNSMSCSKTTIIIYPGIKDEVITALIRSSLESNWSTNRPLGLQRICVTATAAKIECQLLRNCTLKKEIHNNCDTEQI